MKPTVRVSIGGLAFILEEDAYALLDNYLKALRTHFEGNPEADEIIADIESRLSELLQMRVKGNDGIVSIADAQEIIKIMGNPKDFDDTSSFSDDAIKEGNNNGGFSSDYFKKRLMRDTDNKIVGGVCSGLSHYFKIDAVAIRLVFAGLFVLLFIFANRGPSSLVVPAIYGILWIVMPPARTFKQKLEMTGEDPSILNIEDERVKNTPGKYKGSSIGSALGIFVNIIVGLFAFVCALFLIFIIGGLLWFNFDTEVVNLNNYLILLGYSTVKFKVAVFLALVLPVAGLMNLLFKILRRSPFTTRTTISFVIGLVFWFGSLFYLSNKGMRFIDHSYANAEVPVDIKTDTLHVKIGEEYLDAIPQPNNPAVYYRGERERRRQVCILPTVHIREDSLLTDYKIEVGKNAFGSSRTSMKKNAESLDLEYSNSQLIVKPRWYSQSDPWNQEIFDLYIYVPMGKKVIIEPPLSRSYDINSVKIRINGHDYFSHYRNFNYN
ncbi:MAG: PspC domain-containing protein [Dysgonomonas sp.]|nr:PspC domain-containing protein [Dysgonomonas sp.]